MRLPPNIPDFANIQAALCNARPFCVGSLYAVFGLVAASGRIKAFELRRFACTMSMPTAMASAPVNRLPARAMDKLQRDIPVQMTTSPASAMVGMDMACLLEVIGATERHCPDLGAS
jgi:hypothetical protein